MKNTFSLLFLLFLSCFFLQAQTFDIETFVEEAHQAMEPDELIQTVKLRNKTVFDRTIKWKLLSTAIPNEWEYESLYFFNFIGGGDFDTEEQGQGIMKGSDSVFVGVQMNILKYSPNLTRAVAIHQFLIWDAEDSLNSHVVVDLKSTVVSEVEPAIGMDTSIIRYGSEETVAQFPYTANHFLFIGNNSNFPLTFKWRKISEIVPAHWSYTPSVKIDNRLVVGTESGEIDFKTNETKGFTYILENIIPSKFQTDTAITQFVIYNPQDSVNFNRTIEVTTIIKLPTDPGASFNREGTSFSSMVLQKGGNNLNPIQSHRTLLIRKNFPLPLTLNWEKVRDDQPTVWSNQRSLSLGNNLAYDGDIPSKGTFIVTDELTRIELGIPFGKNDFLEEPGSAELQLHFYDPRDSLGTNFTFSFLTSICPFLEGALINNIDQEICGNQPVTIQAVAGLNNYQWTFSDTIVTTDLPTLNTFPAPSITLNAIHPLGCRFKDTLTYLLKEVQQEEICLVTIEETTGYNLLTWNEVTNLGNVKSYNIYRESNQVNIYEKIGAVGIEEPNTFLDSMANPLESSHRYKISVVDSCNIESTQSDFHKTLHLQINQGINGEVNLFWDKYEGFDYNTFFIYRGSTLADMFLIAERPANTFTFTDLTPPSGSLFYQIEVRKEEGCIVSNSRNNDFAGSRSNPVNKDLISSIKTEPLDQIAKLFPNPATHKLQLVFNDFKESISTLEIYNLLGQSVKQVIIKPGEKALTIPIYDLTSGIYMVILRGESIYSEKVVIQK